MTFEPENTGRYITTEHREIKVVYFSGHHFSLLRVYTATAEQDSVKLPGGPD
jgi:hypothetical protein